MSVWRSWLWGALGAGLIGVLACCQIVVNELSQTCTVEPGGTCKGTIDIRNAGSTPAQVRIGQSDYLSYADGRTLYLPSGSLSRSNADWISLEIVDRYLQLEPGSAISVPYTVRAPDGPEVVGSFWSLVVVDNVLHVEPEANEREVVIQQSIGYGVQLITHIGDTGRRSVDHAHTWTRRTPEGVVLEVDLENTGQRALRPVVWAELYSSAGEPMGTFYSVRKRILPGCSARFRLALPRLERGTYLFALIVDNLDEYVWAAELAIEVQ